MLSDTKPGPHGNEALHNMIGCKVFNAPASRAISAKLLQRSSCNLVLAAEVMPKLHPPTRAVQHDAQLPQLPLTHFATCMMTAGFLLIPRLMCKAVTPPSHLPAPSRMPESCLH